VPLWAWEALQWADDAKAGLWPVAGGRGDQTHRALELMAFCRAEESRLTADLSKQGEG